MKKSEALKILGLSDGATEDAIKKAHRKLARENHPDKFGQESEARAAAEERMKNINEARDVLISGKWDPEFSGRPTGSPYGYDPFVYQRPTGTQTGQQGSADPFEGWPFAGATTFVWTSYDADGNPHTYRSDGTGNANPFTGMGDMPFGDVPFGDNPFAGTPFDFASRVSPELELKNEKATLQRESALIGIKMLALATSMLLGAPALGLYLWVIGSIGWSIYKNLSLLGTIFVVPLTILAFIFAPSPNSAIGFFGLVAFLLAVFWDISDVHNRLKRISMLKERCQE